MKLENFKECASIVDKINQIQKIIDSINDCDNVAFINQNSYPIFDINTTEPNQSKYIYLAALEFKNKTIELLNSEVYQLNRKLDLL